MKTLQESCEYISQVEQCMKFIYTDAEIKDIKLEKWKLGIKKNLMHFYTAKIYLTESTIISKCHRNTYINYLLWAKLEKQK